MSKKQSQESEPKQSKRQILREQREKKQRQQRLLMVLGIAAVALIFAAIFIVPSILQANQPVGDIVKVTPAARIKVNGTTMGDPNAPVKIEVFEDFQCPACRNYTETVEPEVVKNLVDAGKIYYVFRSFPFIDSQSLTKESHQAANAAMCASDQNRFWDYHDTLFANWTGENVGSFTDKRLVAFAQTLGLDMNAFNACFQANKHKDQIDADYAAGQGLGVNGTPSVFVNGKIIAPGSVPTYAQINAEVQAALAKQ